MSDIIQLLPDSVANQIAAGEVIQRPASVIKELVENAVDAGAKNIQVMVVDAGRTSIQVIDDGKGMSETDARLSFERHATSKIRQADDLFALHTMGFRGEALASIAAVAQVELRSRPADEELGTHLSIAASRIVGQEPVACPVGSNFLVANLFFNVPARRKFLKSNATEMNNIMQAFERIALVYPDISFSFTSNGSELLCLRPGSLRQRIVDVIGKRINQDLLPVDVNTTVCKISGFVGKPESARKKGAHQFFFVNGRFMRHPYFHKAVQNAFERLVPVGEQVPYFIYFEVPAEDIDVNIHPTKTEIKFENEQAIWQILSAAVKEAVGLFNDVPSIDFDTQGRPEIPVFDPSRRDAQAPRVPFDPQYNPFTQPRKNSADQGWEKLYEGLRSLPTTDQDAVQPDLFGQEADSGMFSEKSPVHYQYKGCYIMTAVKSGLMIINQHRAHVRILYEQYIRQLTKRAGHPQKVLFPEIIQFPVSESVILEKIMPDMEHLGFDISDLGGGSYAVNGIPAGLEGVSAVKLVRDMVSTATSGDTSAVDDVNHQLALCLARNAAIPQGQVLGNEEMENLVNELFSCSNATYTPDGQKVLCILQQSEIDGMMT